MQQREEKQLESALESIIQRVNDLKASLAAMIFKIENEYETLNWPKFLDNYALISGQVGSYILRYFSYIYILYFVVNFSIKSSKSR